MMLYICMSIAGSIPVVVCLILWAIQRQNYNFLFARKLLLTGMFFYLVPFQMVKYVLPERVISALSFPEKKSAEQTLSKFVAVKSFTSAGDAVWIPMWATVLLMVWLWCVIIFAVYQVVRYRIDIQKLLAKSERVSVEINGKAVELYLHKNIRTPYTVGFFRPVIIMPKDSLVHPCFSMIYKHEEQHRKSRDSLMKLFCIIIICVHCLNPIAILLLFLYNVTAEYVCDAYAGEKCSDEEKKKYLRLLIDLSSIDEPLSVVWRNNLSGSQKLMKRRIDYMMRKKKMGLVRRGVAIAASVVTVFASASTIFAYEPLMSTNENAVEVIRENGLGNFYSDSISDGFNLENTDCFFVYEDGTKIAISSKSSTYALCNHKLVNGYYQIHTKNSSGGCTTKEYYAKKCSKCGYLEIGDLHVTVTYPVCPH